MNTAYAIAAAQDWVLREACRLPGCCGAYLSGSVLEKALDEAWPADSDVDVVLLFEAELPPKIGKFRWQQVLMEITAMHRGVVADEETVLSTHYLAFALNGGQALHDPQGLLGPMMKRVQEQFYQEKWLLARVATTAEIARRNISGMAADREPEAAFMSCGFGPSAIALPILAAAGCNCTVRKRLPKARDVLRRFGYGDFSANLERVLGCHGMTAAELLPHMDALERTYYLAMGTKGPSEEYAFRSDIRPDAKAVAIDGTRELLLSENPSDAVFWMIATFTRCMTILRMDDMDAYRACLADMRAFAAALGVADARGIAARHALALQTLADAEEIARRIAAETAR